MTSSRPYLLRAIYQWIIDNGATPYVLVDTSMDNVTVPVQYIQDNKIILNIGPMAVQTLVLGNNEVMFSARFSGSAMEVFFPVQAVLAIYAKENGQGMVFNDSDLGESEAGGSPDDDKPSSGKAGKPNLRVVK